MKQIPGRHRSHLTLLSIRRQEPTEVADAFPLRPRRCAFSAIGGVPHSIRPASRPCFLPFVREVPESVPRCSARVGSGVPMAVTRCGKRTSEKRGSLWERLQRLVLAAPLLGVGGLSLGGGLTRVKAAGSFHLVSRKRRRRTVPPIPKIGTPGNPPRSTSKVSAAVGTHAVTPRAMRPCSQPPAAAHRLVCCSAPRLMGPSLVRVVRPVCLCLHSGLGSPRSFPPAWTTLGRKRKARGDLSVLSHHSFHQAEPS